MATQDLGNTITTQLDGSVQDFSVDKVVLDYAPEDQESEWDFPDAATDLGYYRSIPEYWSAIKALTTYTVGKGFTTESARDGIITREMTAVAISEQVTPEFIRERVANGTIAIPANIHHTHLQPVGVGRDLRCKINANLGNSPLSSGIENEIDKLETAIRYGADAVMDLSTGDHIDKIRTAMIEASSAPCSVTLPSSRR